MNTRSNYDGHQRDDAGKVDDQTRDMSDEDRSEIAREVRDDRTRDAAGLE